MADLSARIDELADRASRDRASASMPPNPPDEERAMAFLRNGVGPAIWVYVEGRTGEWVRFDPEEFDRLEGAMNDWLECYAACYGQEIDAAVTLREAAEALLDTHNIHDVARILTHVPSRERAVEG